DLLPVVGLWSLKARIPQRPKTQGNWFTFAVVVACPSYCSLAFVIFRRRHWSGRGMTNPGAVNQIPHRLWLPSSLSLLQLDTAHNVRNDVSIEQEPFPFDRSARKSPPDCKRLGACCDSVQRFSMLLHHGLRRP